MSSFNGREDFFECRYFETQKKKEGEDGEAIELWARKHLLGKNFDAVQLNRRLQQLTGEQKRMFLYPSYYMIENIEEKTEEGNEALPNSSSNHNLNNSSVVTVSYLYLFYEKKYQISMILDSNYIETIGGRKKDDEHTEQGVHLIRSLALNLSYIFEKFLEFGKSLDLIMRIETDFFLITTNNRLIFDIAYYLLRFEINQEKSKLQVVDYQTVLEGEIQEEDQVENTLPNEQEK